MKKNLIALMLVLLMMLGVCANAEEMQVIELGTSGLTMSVPADYAKDEITAEDTDESQVAYYKSESSLVDFDIYQWAKAEGEELAAVAAAEAAEFGAETVESEVNGIKLFYYEAVEESEGTEYPTTTFMMENGDYFAEIVFWMDGEDAGSDVEAMINTLTVAEAAEISDGGNVIELGTTGLTITTPYTYEKGEISAEDTDESQVAYYKSEETLVDFDVYQWAKAEGEELAAVAAAEAAEFGAEIVETEVNGIKLFYYEAVEESEGTEYPTTTFMMENGDYFAEIVFWLDGEDAGSDVEAIINTLTK